MVANSFKWALLHYREQNNITEADFRYELVRGMEQVGHVVPIPDSGSAKGGKKKYDLGFLQDADYHALELKQVKDGYTLSFRRLEIHQEAALKDAVDNGGSGWVVCNFRVTPTTDRSMAKYGAKVNRAFLISITKYLKIRDEKDGNGGISMEDFQKRGLELEHSHVNKLQSWEFPTRLYRYDGKDSDGREEDEG